MQQHGALGKLAIFVFFTKKFIFSEKFEIWKPKYEIWSFKV